MGRKGCREDSGNLASSQQLAFFSQHLFLEPMISYDFYKTYTSLSLYQDKESNKEKSRTTGTPPAVCSASATLQKEYDADE